MNRKCISKLLAALAITWSLGGAAQAQDLDGLAEKAAEDGTVRVIARVPVDHAPEGVLSPEAQFRQQLMMAEMQAEVARSLAAIEGLEVVTTFETLPLLVVEAAPEGLDALTDSGVAFVEDELSAPYLADTIGLIHANEAHDAGSDGSGQVVAVLDTGVDTAHPFLAGKSVAQACFSTTSSANGGSTSFCPNGQNTQTGGNAGQHCSAQVVGCDHGTHVAGIAVGNGPDFTGVAPGAGLIPIQVFSRFASAEVCSPRAAPCALSYTSDQIRALEHVRDLAPDFDIAAANMSLGGGRNLSHCDTDPRKPIIDTLNSLGIATVVATGNDGFTDGIGAPACISSAVSVGSTTKADTLSGFSNSAAIVDVLAPGSSINSSVPGTGFGFKSGTSMATPHVAGGFAVAFSADPNASVADVLADLQQSGVSVTGGGVTKPRIDLGHLAEQPPPAGTGPLAFGTVWFDGRKMSGTSNWSATYNPTYNRYEITIAGEPYYYLSYSTIVTPAGDVRFCRSSSVGGRLLVYCADEAGAPATSRFGFVTFKN